MVGRVVACEDVLVCAQLRASINGVAEMRLIVTAQLVPEIGDAPIWGYHHDEVVQFRKGEDGEEAMLRMAQKLLDRVDEAKTSLGEQIAAEGAQP